MDERARASLPPDLAQLFADDGVGRLLAAELPPGAAVWPDPGYAPDRTHSRPAFWISDAPARDGLWAELRAEHRHSGLWPVLLEETVQPWSAGQIAPDPPSEIDNYRPAAFMAEVWSDWVEQAPEEEIEELAPFGRDCPGLAEPGTLQADADAIADWYAGLLAERRMPLGLAAVERGADAMAVMGWQGALHHNEWTPPLAAVVRTWEDRFAVRVVSLGFNTLELSVAAPPVTHAHALHVAAEHWAFCPDSILQGPGTLLDYADQIQGANAWSFWWD
jgi:hypothetical protein